MNYKALAAGAVLGFLMAVAPACGGGEDECGTNNCAGCCTADGVCTESAAQTPQACGASGNACVACAANQNCVGGTCVTPTQPKPDAGTDAGNTCQGCLSKTTNVCLPGNGATNCGSGGVTCEQCTTGQLCGTPPGGTGNSCYTPPVTVNPVGLACTDATACTELGTGAECRTQTADGKYQYPGGYCTKTCQDNVACGDGGLCGPIGFTVDGGFQPILESASTCITRCTPETQTTPAVGCRQGYVCVGLGSGSGVCMIDVPDTEGRVGQPCTSSVSCAFPPSQGYCYTEIQNGQPSGFKDGMCLADCTTGGEDYCGDGGTCVPQSSTFSVCLPTCDLANPRATCRDGYTCFIPTQGATTGVCLPDCSQPNWGCEATEVCDTVSGYCAPVDAGTP